MRKLSNLFHRKSPKQEQRDITIRSIVVRADTVDIEGRSVEAVMSTEDVVTVFDWERYSVIDEILLARGAELPDQVVVLENHWRTTIDDVFGSARNLRVEGSQTVGRVFFAAGDERVDRAWTKYRDGHARDVSVGYKPLEFTDIKPGERKTIAGTEYRARDRVLRVTTHWKLRELSLTPIGADERAKTRNEPGQRPTTEGDNLMNPRLRKYLESSGMRRGATDDEAKTFQGLLSGRHGQIAEILAREDLKDEGSKMMARLALEQLGVNADDPSGLLGDRLLTAYQSPLPAVGGELELRTTPEPAATPSAEEILAEERERVAMVRRVAGDDLTPEVIEEAVREGWDEARVSQATVEAIRAGRTPAVGAAPAGHSRSREQDVNARSIAAGLMIGRGVDPTEHSMFLNRGLPTPADRLTEQDADRGHALQGMSLPDVFRDCLELDTGKRYRTLDEALLAARPDEVHGRSASTSGATLSYVFGTNAYASLIAGWETVGDTTQGWCDEEDVPNFLSQEDITFKGAARLVVLPRGDTAKHATASDTHETYKIARYARQWVMDEQDVIDDRLGALMKMAAELGEAARRFRPDLVYSLMLENPTLVADSIAVFQLATHANLGTGVLSEANLKVAIQAMGTQRDSNANVLNITPTHLIGPPDLQWTSRELTKHQTLIKLFADSSDPKYSAINQLAEIGLTPVSDGRLDATGVVDPRTGVTRTGNATNWFLAKSGSRSIRVAYRRGTGRRPQMRRFVLDRGQWGIGFDINLDIGAAFMDYLSWYKSTGAG